MVHVRAWHHCFSFQIATILRRHPGRAYACVGIHKAALHNASPPGLFRGSMRDARRLVDLALDCRRYDGPKDKACSNAFQQYVFFLAK